MVSPEHFNIEYAINPHMLDAAGRLQKVDVSRAQVQWRTIKKTYESLGFPVSVLPADGRYPDMVFCANQTLPFLGSTGERCAILGNMHAEQRKPEVSFFKEWFSQRGVQVFELGSELDFEGAGDCIWNFGTGILYCGFGHRTDRKVLGKVGEIAGAPVRQLRLVDDRFYHLDTCFTVLNRVTAGYVEEAFDSDGLHILRRDFPFLIRISVEEGLRYFSGNAHSPDGHHVITHSGSTSFKADLLKGGFSVIEVDTSEFLKSGGSVFCMKQMFY